MSALDFDGTQTVQVNGAGLAYRESGAGDPVVFIHGDLSDLRCWDPLAAEVEENPDAYRRILLDFLSRHQ